MSKKKPAARLHDPKGKRNKKVGDFTFTGADHKQYSLTLKEKLFCEAYMEHRGNRTQAIIDAGYNVTRANGTINYNLASVMGGENLRKPQITQYITILMDKYGWNDENADKQLLVIMQQNDDLGAKKGALDIFYKLRGRYAPQKVEVSDLRKLKDDELLAAAGLSPTDDKDNAGQS